MCSGAGSVAISNDGRIFVAGGFPYAVYALSLTGALLGTLIFPTRNIDVAGLVFDPVLNRLYGADPTNNRVIAFSAALPSTLNGSLCALFYGLPGAVDYPWPETHSPVVTPAAFVLCEC